MKLQLPHSTDQTYTTSYHSDDFGQGFPISMSQINISEEMLLFGVKYKQVIKINPALLK